MGAGSGTEMNLSLKHVVEAGALGALLLSGPANAALVDRGRGLIYDTDRDITWLQDWNYAKTSGYDDDGVMSWSSVKTWVDGLVFGGYSDWRLPTALNPDGSGPCMDFGCTGGEMGHVWLTELGNKSYCADNACKEVPQPGWGLTHTGPFRNMQDVDYGVYWTGTEYDSTRGWFFSVKYGQQEFGEDPMFEYAVAVRHGDVTAVPEPGASALVLWGMSAVAMAMAMARRRAGPQPWRGARASPSSSA
jgi:hypothetical protein